MRLDRDNVPVYRGHLWPRVVFAWVCLHPEPLSTALMLRDRSLGPCEPAASFPEALGVIQARFCHLR